MPPLPGFPRGHLTGSMTVFLFYIYMYAIVTGVYEMLPTQYSVMAK